MTRKLIIAGKLAVANGIERGRVYERAPVR
jgi:hypothetical protein